jgi:hypothetical protein
MGTPVPVWSEHVLMTTTPPDVSNNEQLSKILLAREHARADAWFRRDRRALDALLASDYREINNFGHFNREDILGRIFPLFTLHSLAIEGPRVTKTGADTAMITYTCTQDATFGKIRKTGTFQVSAHYTLAGNLWKISLWEIVPETEK